MKYTLDTIPVWDAYKKKPPCPFCLLQSDYETAAVESLLASYMEPDCRIETNKKGFCKHHSELLYQSHNRLGLALMMETHFLALSEELELIKKEKPHFQNPFKLKKKSSLSDQVQAMSSRCFLCDQLDAAMRRYAYTAARLFFDQEEFRTVFNQSNGVCLKHLGLLLDVSYESLSQEEFSLFSQELLEVTISDLKKLQHDLHLFTLQFDYRFHNINAPKEAIEQALQKRNGSDPFTPSFPSNTEDD